MQKYSEHDLKYAAEFRPEIHTEALAKVKAVYPDVVCDYCLVDMEDKDAKAIGVFPYRGVDSHRFALECAAWKLFDGGKEWSYDTKGARCRKLRSEELFAPVNSDKLLNYRKAFLCPPHMNDYTDNDFERVNVVLFPAGTESLEAYRWTTDWSEYFDEGHEWWGTLCLTVYDQVLERFVIIMASATD